jgi:hypothetical protein
MLAAVYSAIGLFASSLTTNQVISFIIAAVLSFLMFRGFDSLSTAPPGSHQQQRRSPQWASMNTTAQ